jgi:hypothetical protein
MEPSHFVERPEVLSTLVHEMVHLWQYHHGKPSRSGYHNTEWAAKMAALGLMPSNTSAPGDKRTGQQMTHYIIAGGLFGHAADALLASGLTISWGDLRQIPLGRRPTFSCPNCG